MEQIKIEGALEKLWKKYIEIKMELALMMGDWSSETELKLDSIEGTDEIIEYVKKEIVKNEK